MFSTQQNANIVHVLCIRAQVRLESPNVAMLMGSDDEYLKIIGKLILLSIIYKSFTNNSFWLKIYRKKKTSLRVILSSTLFARSWQSCLTGSRIVTKRRAMINGKRRSANWTCQKHSASHSRWLRGGTKASKVCTSFALFFFTQIDVVIVCCLFFFGLFVVFAWYFLLRFCCVVFGWWFLVLYNLLDVYCVCVLLAVFWH